MNQEFHLLHKVVLKASAGTLQGYLVNIGDRRRIDWCGLKARQLLAKTGYITMSVGAKHISNLAEKLFERFLLLRLSFWCIGEDITEGMEVHSAAVLWLY